MKLLYKEKANGNKCDCGIELYTNLGAWGLESLLCMVIQISLVKQAGWEPFLN